MNFTCFFLNVAIRKYKITHVVCICGSDYNYHIGQCFSRGNGKMRKFERSSHLEKKLSNLKDKKQAEATLFSLLVTWSLIKITFVLSLQEES